MFSKPLAFGLVALGCVTAAAGGAYVATRHNAAEVQTTAPAAATPAASPASQSVRETEAAVTPAAAPAVSQTARTADAPRETAKRPAESRAALPERSSAPKPREAAGRTVVARQQKPAPASKATDVVAKQQPDRTVPLPERPIQPAATSADPAPAPVAPIQPAAATDGSNSATVDTPRTSTFEELVLPAASVIGLQLETALTSERAHVEDRVEARVTRDVLVDGRLAIPAGSRVLGSVTQVDRGGKLKDRARLAIRFHTLVLGDGTEVSLRTEPITREGEAPAGDSSKKIGGAAVGGAILGAILGGGKGAMIGGMAGAGGGTAMVMAGDRNPATFQPGTIVTARLAAPVTIERRR